jgi:hypothetical protein
LPTKKALAAIIKFDDGRKGIFFYEDLVILARIELTISHSTISFGKRVKDRCTRVGHHTRHDALEKHLIEHPAKNKQLVLCVQLGERI